MQVPQINNDDDDDDDDTTELIKSVIQKVDQLSSKVDNLSLQIDKLQALTLALSADGDDEMQQVLKIITEQFRNNNERDSRNQIKKTIAPRSPLVKEIFDARPITKER